MQYDEKTGRQNDTPALNVRMAMRKEILFNDNWEFVRLGFGTELADFYEFAKGKTALPRAAETSDETRDGAVLRYVNIPHDWLIYDTRELYMDSTGWYRKRFALKKETGRRYLINFDGVYMDSTLYVNGKPAGTHHYGYSAFEYDITDLLADGDNELIMQIRHKSPNTRWYSGAGIFRDVTFKDVPQVHIATDGVYVSAKKTNGRWTVTANVEVTGGEADMADRRTVPMSAGSTGARSFTADIRLLTPGPGDAGTIGKPCPEAADYVPDDSSNGDNCAVCEHPCASRGSVRVSDFEIRENGFSFAIDNPFIWDITSPNLYELTVTLMCDGAAADEVSTRFGLREIEYTADRGFFLNGRRVKIYGVCEHHDLGCLGSAFDKSAMRRKILVLKQMGVNAIRTSHNMPARGLMELADEMGIMIDSEAFDMWRRSKTEFDYARFFDADCESDIRSWVRRDRNHPSVIMWSIGNEIYDCHADASAVKLTGKLKGFVEENDYMHNAPVTHGSNFMAWEGAQNCTDVLKLAGYNYGERLYDDHHAKHPDWMIYGSETSSTVQSRGIYHFPMNVSVMADDDEQCSGLGNCTTSWGAENVEYVIKADRDHAFSAGQFLWSGFDYIGEPTPYHTKNSYFGQIDTAGFPKDTYYIFKAEWTDAKIAPFVHVFPYWDFNEGQLIDVRAATNGASVELIVNGESQGKKEIDHEHGQILCPTWQVPYHKGYIEAIAYDADGREIARDRRDSFGEAAEIKYKRFDLKAGSTAGNDEPDRLAFFEIYAVDADGHEVENADTEVRVSVTGGELLGLDNGDSTDFDQYKCDTRRLFGNRLLAVVRADEGHSADEISIAVEPTGNVPVRKLEIVSHGGQTFGPEHETIDVEAIIMPGNASYSDVTWIAVNDYAVKTNLAELEPDGRKCRIHAKGDGKFRIRCMTKNGTDRQKCISSLEFTAEGIGTAYFNPYEFVAGSLYTDSKGDVGNGNEKGVATPRGEESYIGYTNLDFGEFGSDEITLPIFTLDSKEYVLQIWEGRPGEAGSELLCDGRYCKPSIWNVYQPETYKLKRRVKGITSIYFTANDKYHLKGFTFTAPDKAFARIAAAENSRIYGDTFTLNPGSDEITGIGNNVTIEFDGMDFGVRTAHKLIITGRSAAGSNSIHLRVSEPDGTGAVTKLLEFEQSDDYVERSFDIGEVTGNKRIGFVFLPGSNFDLKYFKFE